VDESNALPEVRKTARQTRFAASLLWVLGLGAGMLATAFFVSWSFGLVAFENVDARELFRRVSDGRSDVRRGAALEWARRLQASEERKGAAEEELRPTALEVQRLSLDFASAPPEGADLVRLAGLASVLGHSRSALAGDALCRFLEVVPMDTGIEAQVHALLALRRLGRSCPPVWERMAVQTDRSVRKAAALALGATTDLEPVSALLALLRDAEADVRWNAAFSLAAQKNPAARETVRSLLAEVEAAARGEGPVVDALRLELFGAALRAALQLEDDELKQRVETVAKSHPNVKVRGLALSLLR
jgi:hypothetical protein